MSDTQQKIKEAFKTLCIDNHDGKNLQEIIQISERLIKIQREIQNSPDCSLFEFQRMVRDAQDYFKIYYQLLKECI